MMRQYDPIKTRALRKKIKHLNIEEVGYCKTRLKAKKNLRRFTSTLTTVMNLIKENADPSKLLLLHHLISEKKKIIEYGRKYSATEKPITVVNTLVKVLDSIIDNLVTRYGVDINGFSHTTKNPTFGMTPLQLAMNIFKYANDRLFSVEDLMNLVRLGANPFVKSDANRTLLEEFERFKYPIGHISYFADTAILAAATLELRQRIHHIKNHYLNTLIILANDYSNPKSDSFITKLPLELVEYILSFLSFGVEKEKRDCLMLSRFIFDNHHAVKSAMRIGGIHVKQKTDTNSGLQTFRFFKSPSILCQDIEKNLSALHKQSENTRQKIKQL